MEETLKAQLLEDIIEIDASVADNVGVILTALEDLGVAKTEHLRHVEEKDFGAYMTTISSRALIKFWKQKYGNKYGKYCISFIKYFILVFNHSILSYSYKSLEKFVYPQFPSYLSCI